MRIHYVEDDKADVIALRHALRSRRDLTIDTSERLDQFAASPGTFPLDALLIDVMRPDSVSLESDVRAARSVTGAPLIFVTGLDPSPLRDRALRAGADGVLSKNALDVDLLTQCLENAKAGRGGGGGVSLEVAPPFDRGLLDREPQWPMASPTLGSVDAALAALEYGLGAPGGSPGDVGEGAASVEDLALLARMLRMIGSRSFHSVALCEPFGLWSDIERKLMRRADELGVAAVMESDARVQWAALGSRRHALAGLEALVRAALLACRPNDWLQVTLHASDGQARLDVSSNQLRIADLAEVFVRDGGEGGVARAFMECAVHLLGVRREQVKGVHRSISTLTVFL